LLSIGMRAKVDAWNAAYHSQSLKRSAIAKRKAGSSPSPSRNPDSLHSLTPLPGKRGVRGAGGLSH
jgi:hypothetical protein